MQHCEALGFCGLLVVSVFTDSVYRHPAVKSSVKSAQLLHLFTELLNGHSIAHAVHDPLHGVMTEIKELFYKIAINEVFAFPCASLAAP